MTRLKEQRERKGLTQATLAERSGVNIRIIQAYEQRRKDINKANVMTVLSLSEALGVSVYDVIER
jgi:transcriptional regulator with XRE-family HTH domain